MHERVTSGQVAMGRLEEALRRAQGNTGPRAERGFRSNMTLIDRQTGKWVIVGLWESEADLQATMARHERDSKRFVALGYAKAMPTTEV